MTEQSAASESPEPPEEPVEAATHEWTPAADPAPGDELDGQPVSASSIEPVVPPQGEESHVVDPAGALASPGDPVADAPAAITPPPTPPIEIPAAPPAPRTSSGGASDRPELAIGGAFVGGLVLALILKRLAR